MKNNEKSMKFKKGDGVIIRGSSGIITVAANLNGSFRLYSVKCNNGSIINGLIEDEMEIDKQWYREQRLRYILSHINQSLGMDINTGLS